MRPGASSRVKYQGGWRQLPVRGNHPSASRPTGSRPGQRPPSESGLGTSQSAHQRLEPPNRQPGAERRVHKDAEHGPQTVSPTDLLAFRVRARRVRDTDLVHTPIPPSDLGRHLRLDSETVLLELEGVEDLGSERLV